MWRQSQGMVAILTVIVCRTNTQIVSPGEIHPFNQIPKTVLLMNLIMHSYQVAENYTKRQLKTEYLASLGVFSSQKTVSSRLGVGPPALCGFTMWTWKQTFQTPVSPSLSTSRRDRSLAPHFFWNNDGLSVLKGVRRVFSRFPAVRETSRCRLATLKR